jgi:predicted nucleotidyltransferase
MKSTADELFGRSRAAVLESLLLRPDESTHVRELARATGISAGTLHRELRALEELGLLTRREVGRQVFYAANRAHPIFEDLASLLQKTGGYAATLREALTPIARSVRAAFIYGSMASGDARPQSDIDVMVLGDVKFADVVRALAPAERKLRREVNPTVMRPAEFARRRREKDGFVTTALRRPKVWLIGSADDLGKSGQDGTA